MLLTSTFLPLIIYAGDTRTISRGSGFGTYYYDVDQVHACGTAFEFQNSGPVGCGVENYISLNQIDSNYLVAMNNTQLVGNWNTYCGKRVIVSVNGQSSSLPLFIGDGCTRCSNGPESTNVWNPAGAPGLDFSYSVLNELSANACADGHISITWEIIDEMIYPFDHTSSYISRIPTPTCNQVSYTAMQITLR
ncbi:hypothetical protein BDV59DRAFT_196836 [Aspergillus ambiguus]|uniref:RlpA-like double-psi beta-barrel domain-containing protein n=1 Tax=Aspergillus ambiguus TaxID=176160 RepID=UPI003CCDE499